MAVDWTEYAKGIEKQLAEIKKDLEPLEVGRMTLGEREGNGHWRAVTKEMLERHKQNLTTYEAILKAVLAKAV